MLPLRRECPRPVYPAISQLGRKVRNVLLKGIVVPIGTPVDREERVDEADLRKLLRYLLTSDIHGILANGSMGGFAHLEDREQMRALEIILDEVGGRIPVAANVGENGTRRVLRRAREFESLNPDYLSILPPFYFLMTQEQLKHFYEEVVNGVQTPSFLYNNPYTTKSNLEIDTILALSEHPNVVGIKDSKQDFEKWMRLVRHFRNSDFSVLVGTESLVSASLIAGCDGVIAGLHNLCPQLAVRLYDAVQAGDGELAASLQDELNELFAIFQNGNVWGAFEVGLQHLGLAEKVTVSPFRPIVDRRQRGRIVEILDRHIGQPARSVDLDGTA